MNNFDQLHDLNAQLIDDEKWLTVLENTYYDWGVDNLEELIESKPTARGQILTKFLGLEALKLKEDNCKEVYNEWSKKLVSNTYNLTQLENDNNLCRNTIMDSENEIVKLTENKNKQINDLKLENCNLKKNILTDCCSEF